ncbi:ATP-binding response regulator [Denitrobaculum tricleocarpae]|uniref:histidine kinase n=1 Tax=Denitrobaculum tricleocarpae TaxID=2591009 RepID=A0A545SYM6_9PROT|nr:hybrid sensor histidine kinase/response regulator [Denitrobaculum tricleocarpae]TQV70074.1 response regulator [Denitrobaculum tricleocarpae]
MTKSLLRILHVEDNPGDARLLREDVNGFQGEAFDLIQVRGASEAVDYLQQASADLVLLDANLPDVVGIATVIKILQVADSIPVVVLTGHEDLTFAEDAVRLGAQNCLVKGSLTGKNLIQQLLLEVQRFRVMHEANAEVRETARERAQYQSIITNNADSLVLIDEQGVVQFVNPSAEALFGRSAERMIGQPFGIPFESLERTIVDLVRPDGTVAVADMRIMRTSWEKGPGYIATLRDITAERSEVRELRIAKSQAERASQLKSSFLAKMSHELRTPLNAILGYSQMIESQILGPIGVPRYIEYVGSIQQAGTHLLNVVNDLLDLSKIEADQFTLNETNLDLVELLSNAMDTTAAIAAQKNMAIELHCDCKSLFVKADATRLSQIFYNLLSNAIKFSPDSSKVELRIISHRKSDPQIKVIDHGCGISKVDRERVFSAFVQAGDATVARESEGTGLGLAVSRELILLHGGDIFIDSFLGKGTTMTILFPEDRVTSVVPSHQKEEEFRREVVA